MPCAVMNLLILICLIMTINIIAIVIIIAVIIVPSRGRARPRHPRYQRIAVVCSCYCRVLLVWLCAQRLLPRMILRQIISGNLFGGQISATPSGIRKSLWLWNTMRLGFPHFSVLPVLVGLRISRSGCMLNLILFSPRMKRPPPKLC